MAGGENITLETDVELEVMSKDDCSWHPCRVSLCPGGVGLVVYYGSDGLEDTFVSEEETLARLRVRSNPLQGDDCIHIKQGEHVLAAENSSSSFFDAEVEKVVKVRHSKKVQCRCTFVVKWRQGDPKEGTRIVPSSLIRKLAKENINVNPTISAFFHAVRTTSPLPNVGNDMDSELDLHELLGKQIEEITNSADTSKKSISEDILFGFQVHTKGQIQHRQGASSIAVKSQNQVTPDKNHLRRSTRKRNELQVETEVKDPPPAVPATQEELPENKSPVNPLAARAALASLMSKLPKNLELSFNQEAEKRFSNSLDIANQKQVDLESLNATEYISSSVTNCFSFNVAFSSDFENRNKISEFTNACDIFPHPIAQMNVSHPRKASRLTCNVSQSVADTSAGSTGNKQMPEKQSRRFTRSAVHKEDKIETDRAEESITELIPKCDVTGTSDKDVIAEESHSLKEKFEAAVRSSLDTETDLASTTTPKSLMKVGGRNKNDIERTSCAFEINNTVRLTRSAIQKVVANKNVGNSQGQVEHKFPESTDSCRGSVTPLAATLSVHAEISLNPKGEKRKKQKTSGASKTIRETEGNAFGDDENSQDLKVLERKSTGSIKHGVRSSPRLSFLPRTRSQSKN